MPAHLEFTLADLVEHAEERFFRRGNAYFRDGHVSSLAVHGSFVHACVDGSWRYNVRLAAAPDENGDLAYSCDCPMGEDGYFCKHVVAAGLAALHAQQQGVLEVAQELTLEAVPAACASEPQAKAAQDAPEALPGLEDLQQLLADASPQLLRHWLSQALQDSPLLRLRMATAALAPPLRCERVLALCRRALCIEEADDDTVAPLMHHALATLSLVEDLLGDSQGQESMHLPLLEQLVECTDTYEDTLGAWPTAAAQVRQRVYALHERACVHPLDAGHLADWLLHRVTRGCPEVRPVLPRYAERLGPEGVARYCQAVWQARSEQAAGAHPVASGSPALQAELEQCVAWQRPDDVELLVQAYALDGSSAAAARLLERLADIGTRQAQQQAQRVVSMLLSSRGGALNERLATQAARTFSQADWQDELGQLCRQQFHAHPHASTYAWAARQLEDAPCAEEVLCELVAHLQQLACQADAWGPRVQLLQVHLLRNDATGAWTAYQQWGAAGHWETAVLCLCARTQPEAVVRICRAALPAAIVASAPAYDRAAELVQALIAARQAQGAPEYLRQELQELRREYRRRTNFIARLNRLQPLEGKPPPLLKSAHGTRNRY